ncbi:esterase [Arthrobacter glacialis]|nr:esterase [Arthrobacter glacialis]
MDSTVQGPHGPIPVRWYSPQTDTNPVSTTPIVWIHGGGFFKGNLDQSESHDVGQAMAAAGFRVITVAYQLASVSRFRRSTSGSRWSPPVHYPVPVDEVVAVVREVQRGAPNGVILGGASAGACLSAATVLRLVHDGADALAGVFFAYGLFHAALPTRSRELRRRLRGLRRFAHAPAVLNLMNLHYAGRPSALSEPDAFPGGHPLRGFPPTLMIDADHDSMRASGGKFAQELSAARIEVDYHVLQGAFHSFLNRPHDPSFADSLDLIVDWARRL